MFEGFTKLRHLDVKKMVIYINIVGYIDANLVGSPMASCATRYCINVGCNRII